ncbi:MAG: Na+/H+ antiporter subunit G [Phycisphaeraceae bacterium]|nr:Na+/H+ antiporter subunit G [Phycisphaeraceae bacterium]
MTINLTTINDLATVLFLVSGLFFMLVATVGLWRLPDFYHRMHAATKGVTLGIVGMLVAALLYVPHHMEATFIAVFTKVVLAIMFQFIANPVGAHLLSKAAHLDGCPKWDQTVFDDLEKSR